MVRADMYPGLDTYRQCASGQAPKRHSADDKEKRRRTRADMSPWELYADAWRSSDRAPIQTAMVVGTIVVGVALLSLFVFALAALARPRGPKLSLRASPKYVYRSDEGAPVPEASWFRRGAE